MAGGGGGGSGRERAECPVASTTAQCGDPGLRNKTVNTTLAAFPSEQERQGRGDLKGAWENQHHAWVYFRDGQNKMQKNGLRKIMTQETISAQETRDCQAATAGWRVGKFLHITNKQFK